MFHNMLLHDMNTFLFGGAMTTRHSKSNSTTDTEKSRYSSCERDGDGDGVDELGCPDVWNDDDDENKFHSTTDKNRTRKGSTSSSRTLQPLPMGNATKATTNKGKGLITHHYFSVIISHKRGGVVGQTFLLFILLGLVYVAIAVILVLSLHPQQDQHLSLRSQPSSWILFDSHVHESERELTSLLHMQHNHVGQERDSTVTVNVPAKVLSSSSASTTTKTSPAKNPNQSSFTTQYIRSIVAPSLGLEVMGSLLDMLQPDELSRHGLLLYQWYVVHGQPIFVRQACSDGEEYVYYSTRRGLLVVRPAEQDEEGLPRSANCHPTEIKPLIWKRMQQLVYHMESTSLAGPEKDVQDGITIFNFHANHDQVFFSSVTTSNINNSTTENDSHVDMTWLSLPHTLERILHGAMSMESNLLASPAYVERLVNDKSWVLVPMSQISTASSHDSATSLCQHPDMITTTAAAAAATVCPTLDMITVEQDYPIQCVSIKEAPIHNKNNNGITFKVIGQWIIPTFETVITRVDWPWALALAAILLFMKVFKIGNQIQKNRSHAPLAVLVYLMAVVVYKYRQPTNSGLFSPEPIYRTIMDSVHAFVLVHPLTSPMIVWSHAATYWFELAAWRSKTVQGVLFWYLCYEFMASYVNEYFHGLEDDNIIRCTRVTFIAGMKQYAVDDVVRAYLLPPFLVYFYLLPKFILSYTPFSLGW